MSFHVSLGPLELGFSNNPPPNKNPCYVGSSFATKRAERKPEVTQLSSQVHVIEFSCTTEIQKTSNYMVVVRHLDLKINVNLNKLQLIKENLVRET